MRISQQMRIVLLAFVGACGAWQNIGAEIFAYRDERGIVHFSNVRETPRWIPLSVPPSVPSRTLDAPKQEYPFAGIVAAHALRAGVDAALVRAIIKVESNFDPRARSHKGAIGLMQLLPQTARLYGRANLYEPVENIRVGIRHLKLLLEKFQNNLRLALAAYNAGAAAVTRYGGVPPFPETIEYVGRVLQRYQTYRRGG